MRGQVNEFSDATGSAPNDRTSSQFKSVAKRPKQKKDKDDTGKSSDQQRTLSVSKNRRSMSSQRMIAIKQA